MIKYIKIKDDRDVKEIIYATQLLQLDTIEDGFITSSNKLNTSTMMSTDF